MEIPYTSFLSGESNDNRGHAGNRDQEKGMEKEDCSALVLGNQSISYHVYTKLQ